MYLIHFDIAAILIIITAIPFYISHQKYAVRGSFQFFLLMISIAASGIFSLITSIAINRLSENIVLLTFILTEIFYIIQNTMPFLMTMYLLTVFFPKGIPRFFKIFITALWGIAILLILSNFFVRSLFYITPDLSYKFGILRPILYGISIVYFLISILSLHKATGHLGGRKSFIFLLVLILPLIAIVLQKAFPGFVLETFSAAISILFILLTVQNSNELKDRRSDLPGRLYILSKIEHVLNLKSQCSLLILNNRSIEKFRTILAPNVYDSLYQAYIHWLKSLIAPNITLASISELSHIIVLDEKRSKTDAGELALKIARRAGIPFEANETSIRFLIQVLLLRIPEDVWSLETLNDLILQFSDFKNAQEGRHIFFLKDFILNRHSRDTKTILLLEEGLLKNNLEPMFQPIVNISSNQISALEVLYEFIDAQGMLIKQGEICHIANENNLTDLLFERMFEKVLDIAKQENYFSLGIRTLEFRLPESKPLYIDWAQNIIVAAQAKNFELTQIRIQIREPTVANTSELLRPGMQLLKKHGVTFALDDFGSDYTSLESIISLPFDVIKFDKMFIKEGLKSKKGQQLLAGSIDLFKALGRKIVAEGIENLENAQALALMGADLLQGYYYSKPIIASEVKKLVFLDQFSPHTLDHG